MTLCSPKNLGAAPHFVCCTNASLMAHLLAGQVTHTHHLPHPGQPQTREQLPTLRQPHMQLALTIQEMQHQKVTACCNMTQTHYKLAATSHSTPCTDSTTAASTRVSTSSPESGSNTCTTRPLTLLSASTCCTSPWYCSGCSRLRWLL